MPRSFERVIQFCRKRRFAATGAIIGPGCRLGRGARLRLGVRGGARGAIVLGPGADLQTGALLEAWGGSIAVGREVFIGPYAVIYGHGGVEIGERTLISMHGCILSSNHTVAPAGIDIRSQPDRLLPTRIGRDVWLGAGVVVLGGVSVGDGCVVGAGAVVTRDLPPNSVAVGVPARVIRTRGPGT